MGASRARCARRCEAEGRSTPRMRTRGRSSNGCGRFRASRLLPRTGGGLHRAREPWKRRAVGGLAQRSGVDPAMAELAVTEELVLAPDLRDPAANGDRRLARETFLQLSRRGGDALHPVVEGNDR